MLHSRIRICVAIAAMFTSGIASADEPVVVELKSGRQLRASTVESDGISTTRLLLIMEKPSIQMQRGVTWSQISRLAAPANQLSKLQIPEGVQVADRSEFSERKPIVDPLPVLADGIPPAPAPARELPIAATQVISWNGQVDCCCLKIFRDPGVVVGVRDYPSLTAPPCAPTSTLPRP